MLIPSYVVGPMEGRWAPNHRAPAKALWYNNHYPSQEKVGKNAVSCPDGDVTRNVPLHQGTVFTTYLAICARPPLVATRPTPTRPRRNPRLPTRALKAKILHQSVGLLSFRGRGRYAGKILHSHRKSYTYIWKVAGLLITKSLHVQHSMVH